MKTIRKYSTLLTLTCLSLFLVGISTTQAKADMFGAYSADMKYQVSSNPGDIQQAKWLKVAAYVVGFVAGVAAGLTEGWQACGMLVDALDGIEKMGAFHGLNYNPSDLSSFDIK
jgi:hypothetical protein